MGRVVEKECPRKNFNPKYLEKISSDEIKNILQGYHKPERILAEERAEMINKFCKVLNKRFEGKIKTLLENSEYKVNKLRKNLDKFTAFSEDPLRKKSNMIIQLLSRFSLVDFKDPEKINPAIDYHLIRLALRNGRVKIKDGKLKLKIINETSVSKKEDTIIREKVIESFKITQETSKKSTPEENWIEWHIARSFCLRDEPLCNVKENTAKDFLKFKFEKKCPLFNSCEKNKEYRKEPIFKTRFY